MATAKVVVRVSEGQTPAVGDLFAGLRFFLLRRVPQRATFIENIEANGGSVVRLEEQADHIIADHLRADAPAGSVSYTFLDQAIRDGQLPDVEGHRAARAVRTARPVGSSLPVKGTRTPFTPEDDQVLYEWVEPYRQRGEPVQGNKIYQMLEQHNPRHTYQAWRDRYIKKLMDRPSPTEVDLDPPATARSASTIVQSKSTRTPFTAEDDNELYNWVEQWKSRGKRVLGNDIYIKLGMENARHPWQAWRDRYIKQIMDRPLPEQVEVQVSANPPPSPPAEPDQVATEDHDFTDEPENTEGDLVFLLENAEDIENLARNQVEDAWDAFSETFPSRSAASWQMFYKEIVRPVYLERLQQEQADQSNSDVVEPAMQEQPAQPEDQSELHEQRQFVMPRGLDKVSLPTDTKKRNLDRSESDEFRAKRQKSASPAPLRHATPLHGIERTIRVEQNQAEVLSDQVIPTQTEFLEDTSLRKAEPHSETIQSRTMERPRPDLFNTSGAALTEANLANQQAQHREQLLHGNDKPQENDTAFHIDIAQSNDQEDLLRGTDLLKDGETASQTDFIETLQNMLPQSWHTDGRFSLLSQRAAETLEQQRREAADTGSPDSRGSSSPKRSSDQKLPHLSDAGTDLGRSDVVKLEEEEEEVDLEQGMRSQPLMSREDDDPLFDPTIELSSIYHHGADETDGSNIAAGSGFHFMDHLKSLMVVRDQSAQPQHQLETEAEVENEWNADREDLELDELDLTVAEPEGGFLLSSPRIQESSLPQPPTEPLVSSIQARHNSEITLEEETLSSSGSDLFVRQPTSRTLPAPRNIRALETQDILDAETQQLDFAIPPPPDFSQDFHVELFSNEQQSLFASRERTPTLPEISESQPVPDEDVETYVQTMRLRGFADVDIIHALKCTSMYPDLTELVLLEQQAGRGVPVDISGVWSEEEDRALEGGDPDALRRLEAKHTWDGCETRLRFLEQWREENDDNDDDDHDE